MPGGRAGATTSKWSYYYYFSLGTTSLEGVVVVLTRSIPAHYYSLPTTHHPLPTTARSWRTCASANPNPDPTPNPNPNPNPTPTGHGEPVRVHACRHHACALLLLLRRPLRVAQWPCGHAPVPAGVLSVCRAHPRGRAVRAPCRNHSPYGRLGQPAFARQPNLAEAGRTPRGHPGNPLALVRPARVWTHRGPARLCWTQVRLRG